MKLFLTSSGFTNPTLSNTFLEQLAKPPAEARVLVVAYARNAEEEFYVNATQHELEYLCFKDIVIANMHYPVDIRSLGDFDVVYVCGGNTFSILAKLKETRLFYFIRALIEKGTFYIGVSAGSVIACKTIEIAGWGTQGDDNLIGLENLNGFGFIDISIFPHYIEELKGEVDDYRKKVKHEVYELTDEQAILVEDGKIVKIG